MASRPQKTLADYLVIAVSPALIMLVVGSLVFFLLEISYSGNYPDRMRWTLFWFVPASVLAARIGIEQGREHARVYSLALGIATSLVMMRYADNFLLSLALLAVAWWCADKLTWDCTLIDDEADSSGQGLLDAAPSDAPEPNSGVAPKEKHAPGRTVLYFSLAALPLFGIGQVFIPASNVVARAYAFRLLWIYLAAALALLLSTSFLGLRRYLRQRRLEMPASIVRGWIVSGTVLLLLILVGCIFLPRPDADYSVTSIGKLVESKVREASRFALLRSDPGKGEGRPIGDAKDNAEQQDANKPGGEKGAGQPGEGNAQKNADQDAQKSKDGSNKSETNSAGKSADQGKSQSSNSSSQQHDQSSSDSKSKRNESGDGKTSKSASDSSGKSDSSDDNKDKAADRESGDGDKDKPKVDGQKGLAGEKQEKQQQDQQPGQKQDGAKPTVAKQNGEKNDAAAQAQSKPNAPSSDLSQRLGSLAKWLFYALFTIFVVWVLIRYWSQIVDGFAQLWAALLALFSGGKKQPAAARTETPIEQPVRRPLPFAAFRSPFATGTAERMRVEDLVQYTFDALQAWANDRNLGRDPEQTPLEFSQTLGARVPNISKEIDETAQLYARVAYSGREISRSCLPVLEKLWRRMSAG